MKKTLILLIVISFFSCLTKKEKKTEYLQHEIPFLNRRINLPKNYISISFTDYKNIIRESYTDTLFVNLKVREIEKMEIKFPDYSMFCDKNNFENTLLITFMFNLRINKFIKNEFADFIIKDLKNKGKKADFIYRNMENKLIDDWLIKVKGKKTYKNSENQIYITHYMASNFGAFVSVNEKEFDFEKELSE
jgi:hypothetical protein